MALFLGGTAAQADAPAPQPRRFTLVCQNRAMPPPIPTWRVDVNLDLKVFYVEGDNEPHVNQVISDDGDRIVFRNWRHMEHNMVSGTDEAYVRSTGGWFYYVSTLEPERAADAQCRIVPPREGFQADTPFEMPKDGPWVP